MSNVPLARRLIAEVINDLDGFGVIDEVEKLREALALLYRRTPVRRMRIKSRRVTPEMRNQIVQIAKTTDLHSAEIAAMMDVNPGRVSEVLQRYVRRN